MFFKQIDSGGDRNYSYIFASTDRKYGAVVDPSPNPEQVYEVIKQDKINIRYLINTHSHFDHSGGNDFFENIYSGGDIIYINSGSGRNFEENMDFSLGDIIFKVIETPGHTPDSICVKIENNLITGDTLFVGKIGGTYGREDALQEFNSLKKLVSFPPETKVWPGHDYGPRPMSTIGEEVRTNPFIKRLDDFDDFLWLKENWAKYKVKHGIK